MNGYLVIEEKEASNALDGVIDIGLLTNYYISYSLNDAFSNVSNETQSVLEFYFVDPQEIIVALNAAINGNTFRKFTIKVVAWYKKESVK